MQLSLLSLLSLFLFDVLIPTTTTTAFVIPQLLSTKHAVGICPLTTTAITNARISSSSSSAATKTTKKRRGFLPLVSLSVDSNEYDSIANIEAFEWEKSRQYISYLFETKQEWLEFCADNENNDLLWEQIKLEAEDSLQTEPEAGLQLYQGILSHKSLIEAIVSIIAHEAETELIQATELKSLFLKMLTKKDHEAIYLDIEAAAIRSPSIGTALYATLYYQGVHALVCYRVGHRLWRAQRRGLAYYLQSTVSKIYSADIHPAAQMGHGIYLCPAAGVVIGETAVCGNDVSILQGVTLGGTGKETGNRHPKVGNGVILQSGATVLGNIKVEDGSVVTAKSIVTKPVPPLAIMSGVPARIQGYRRLELQDFNDDLESHLVSKYLQAWKEIDITQEIK